MIVPNSRRSTAVVCQDDAVLEPAVAKMLDLNGFSLVGATNRGSDVVPLAAQYRPSVVVVDLSLMGEGGFGMIRAIHSVSPDTAVVVLSPFDSLAFLARQAGAVEVFTYEDLGGLRRILPEIAQVGDTGNEMVNAPSS